jgi:hypothetical protein
MFKEMIWTMQIQYEITLDDSVETSLRVIARSKLAKRMRWQATFWNGIISGIILFVYGTLRGKTLSERLIIAILAMALVSGGYWLSYRRNMKRRALKLLRERNQSDGLIQITVELRDDCLWTRQDGTQLSYDWAQVDEIVNAEDGVEFFMRDGGFVFVRNKGFSTEKDREEFLNAASQCLNDAARKLEAH